MKFSARARAAVVAASAVSMLVVPLALPAAAVTQPGKCTKLATKTVGTKLTATVSSCTPVAATGGKGSGTFAAQTGKKAGTIAIKITWAAKKGTTSGTIKFATSKTLGKCNKTTQSARETINGTVTAGTGVAFKTFKKGQKITGSVCIPKKTGGSITLEPGTALKF